MTQATINELRTALSSLRRASADLAVALEYTSLGDDYLTITAAYEQNRKTIATIEALLNANVDPLIGKV